MWVALANAKAAHIFVSKNNSVYAVFYDQSFNDTLTKDIVSFEQLGPEYSATSSKTVWSQSQIEPLPKPCDHSRR